MKYVLAFAASAAAVLLFVSHAFGEDICTDRPGKSYGACTVDAGRFQVEADIYNGTFQSGGTASVFLNPTLKYGLTDRVDVEVNFPMVENVGHTTGVGDLTFLSKFALVNNKAWQATLMPFVKSPVASAGFGNGAWEGGVIAPVQFKLAGDWGLAFSPEVDVLRNSTTPGTHVATQQVVNLSHPITPKITVAGELWAKYDFDPTGTVPQYATDYSIAYLVNSNFQLDAGVNVGLNHNTPNQVYVGVSRRF